MLIVSGMGSSVHGGAKIHSSVKKKKCFILTVSQYHQGFSLTFLPVCSNNYSRRFFLPARRAVFPWSMQHTEGLSGSE